MDLAVYINNNNYICKIHANFGIFMEKSEYFKEIANLAHEKRSTSEYSAEELSAYHEGQKQAYINILMLVNPKNKEIFEKMKINHYEAKNYAVLSLKDLLRRLDLARSKFKAMDKIILSLRPTTIP